MEQFTKHTEKQPISGLVITALRGGAGKTIISVGLIAALKGLGNAIAPFKKGPDYIDAGWLALAAGRPCYNLDTFLIPPPLITHSYLTHSQNTDYAVVEGNRGLYDGIDLDGTTSTAELAKLLNLPVILCIDSTKTTRTTAATVLGCMHFDEAVRIEGVVLNRVAGPRHESVARRNIEHYCGIPVLGAIPKLGRQSFPERHMGLVPTPEHGWAQTSIEAASEMAAKYLDLKALLAIADKKTTPPIDADAHQTVAASHANDEPAPPVRIGVLRDSAFQFYYPENIAALEKAGAQIVWLSPFTDAALPPVDGLYIGGGFPETHAEKLAEQKHFRRDIKTAVEAGMPIYAECGGLMYLGEALVLEGQSHPMAGVLPIVFGFAKRPQGHGYTVIEIDGDNPYYDQGDEIRGHEFHYSQVLKCDAGPEDLVFKMKRGEGIVNKRDGLCYKNVLATYSHIHALGTPQWATALVRKAVEYKDTAAAQQR